MNLKAFGASILYWSDWNGQHALLKSATILINFNINHQQIYRSLLKMPQVYSAIFYRLMMSFNVISYVSYNASHICCYRAKRSCFQDCPTQFSHKSWGVKKKKSCYTLSCRSVIILCKTPLHMYKMLKILGSGIMLHL